eukprot:1604979-Amphidinium_carterae.1
MQENIAHPNAISCALVGCPPVLVHGSEPRHQHASSAMCLCVPLASCNHKQLQTQQTQAAHFLQHGCRVGLSFPARSGHWTWSPRLGAH